MSSRYPRLYDALKRAGHSPFYAALVLLDASRGDVYALRWCRQAARQRAR